MAVVNPSNVHFSDVKSNSCKQVLVSGDKNSDSEANSAFMAE